MLNPILKRHSELGLDNGVLIYKRLIRPILTYASTIWDGTYNTNTNKIEKSKTKLSGQ